MAAVIDCQRCLQEAENAYGARPLSQTHAGLQDRPQSQIPHDQIAAGFRGKMTGKENFTYIRIDPDRGQSRRVAGDAVQYDRQSAVRGTQHDPGKYSKIQSAHGSQDLYRIRGIRRVQKDCIPDYLSLTLQAGF